MIGTNLIIKQFYQFYNFICFASENLWLLGCRDLAFEYCNRTRYVARKLLEGISESLGLEPMYIDKAMDLEKGLQVMAANYYPPCPQPDLALGMTPHSDQGLLTLLVQNNIGGLQLQHEGKWVNVNAIQNAFLVNIGDHLEVYVAYVPFLCSHLLSN